MVHAQPDNHVGVARLSPRVAVGTLGIGGELYCALADRVKFEPSLLIRAHRALRLALAVHVYVNARCRLILRIHHLAGQLAIRHPEDTGLQFYPVGVGIFLDALVG